VRSVGDMGGGWAGAGAAFARQRAADGDAGHVLGPLFRACWCVFRGYAAHADDRGCGGARGVAD